jgi:acetyl esterase/lipase
LTSAFLDVQSFLVIRPAPEEVLPALAVRHTRRGGGARGRQPSPWRIGRRIAAEAEPRCLVTTFAVIGLVTLCITAAVLRTRKRRAAHFRPLVDCLEGRCCPSTYSTQIAYGAAPQQDLLVYSNTTYQNAPIVVLVHGGSWDSGDAAGFASNYVNYFLKQGFVVMAPNYRLVTANDGGGYSNQFPVPVEDVASATTWMVQHAAQYGGNPNEVVMLGTSAGGQIASLLTYDPTGFSDWGQAAPLHVAGFIGDSGVYDFSFINPRVLAVKNYLGPYYGEPQWDVAEAINYATPGQPPALLVDGSNSFTEKNGAAFAGALQGARDAATFVDYQGYTHGEFTHDFASNTQEQAQVTSFLASIHL